MNDIYILNIIKNSNIKLFFLNLIYIIYIIFNCFYYLYLKMDYNTFSLKVYILYKNILFYFIKNK